MSLRSLPKPCSLLLWVLACLLLAACGSSKTPVADENNTGANGVNSTPITLGTLEYQVELSRILNPYDPEDFNYLAGIAPAQLSPPPGQEWLGVFLVVTNNSKRPATPSSAISVTDTQGNVYAPMSLPTTNVFAYRPQVIAPSGGHIPQPDSVAASGPTEASLLLFKIPVAAFDNRPLVLTILGGANQSAKGTVTLDV